MTDANAGGVPRCYCEVGSGLSVRNLVECGAVDFHRNEGVESRDEKNPGHTRDCRDDRYRCGGKSDAGGRRPMAPSPSPSPSWLSRRPNSRRPGGRGPHWRYARSTKALLQLCLRTRLFRGDLSRPARKILGRLAMACAPRRGLLLTRVDAASFPAKKRLASAMPSFFALSAARADVSHQSI